MKKIKNHSAFFVLKITVFLLLCYVQNYCIKYLKNIFYIYYSINTLLTTKILKYYFEYSKLLLKKLVSFITSLKLFFRKELCGVIERRYSVKANQKVWGFGSFEDFPS